jgi:hypothetical protein
MVPSRIRLEGGLVIRLEGGLVDRERTLLAALIILLSISLPNLPTLRLLKFLPELRNN